MSKQKLDVKSRKHIAKALKIDKEHGILSGEERSSLEKLHTPLANNWSQKMKEMAAMTDQEPEKLFELFAQRDERAKLKWYRDERQCR